MLSLGQEGERKYPKVVETMESTLVVRFCGLIRALKNAIFGLFCGLLPEGIKPDKAAGIGLPCV